MNRVRREPRAAGSAIHRVVGELVGYFVFVAQGMGDLKPLKLRDAFAGFFPERAKIGGVDLVLALDLLDHEFGVGYHTKSGVSVIERPLQAAEKAGVFGEVVGSIPEKLG